MTDKEMETTAQRRPRRRFYGGLAKGTVTALLIVSVAVFCTVFGILVRLLNVGITDEDLSAEQKYTETPRCIYSVIDDMRRLAARLNESRRYEQGGTVDRELTIDIVRLAEHPSPREDQENMNPETSYKLGQLMDLEDGGTSLSELSGKYEYEEYDAEYEAYAGWYYSRLSEDYLEDGGGTYDSEEILAAIKEAEAGTYRAPETGAKTAGREASAADATEDSAELSADETDSKMPVVLSEEEIALIQEFHEISGKSISEFSDRFIYLFVNGREIEKKQLQTLSGGTLAEYALKNSDDPDVSLQELYAELESASWTVRNYVPASAAMESLNAGNSNIRYYMKDGQGNVYTNLDMTEEELRALPYEDWGVFYSRKDGEVTEWLAEEGNVSRDFRAEFETSALIDSTETVYIALDTAFPVHDALYEDAKTYDTYAPGFLSFAILAVGSAVCFLFLLVLATLQAGRDPQDRAVRLYRFDRMPAEVEIALALLCGTGAVLLIIGATAAIVESTTVLSSMGMIGVCAAAAMAGAAVILGFYFSLVRRLKAGNLWKNSLIHSIVEVCRSVYAARSTSARLIVSMCALVFLHIFFIIVFWWPGIFVCILIDAVVLLYMIREAAGRQTVIEGLRQIGAGDLEYKVNTSALLGSNRELAEMVNSMGEGLQSAVAEKMKSERLKADLITNVSHDIKTPLTSIINYVDLLKRENIEDPKLRGYIDILDAKSQRLKQLTEDLVEASKISSGNINLEFITLNLNELIQQMNGEFDERFENRKLTLVCSLYKGSLKIYADSRRIWRVLENLYGNVVKYAMPGTRVYIESLKRDGKVLFTMKNVSEHPLNINAEELTERFIRGDVSRSTEGSGLGLSIAQNLTKLQHGTFQIYLDGDLFKVTVAFDEAGEPKEKRRETFEDGGQPQDGPADGKKKTAWASSVFPHKSPAAEEAKRFPVSPFREEEPGWETLNAAPEDWKATVEEVEERPEDDKDFR